jgi:glucosamine kinase
LIPGEVVVVGDMQIALTAAFGAGPGVIVIAGTGSIAYGRNVEGKTARAGGWGFAVSDEGSAHWIGRTAISGLLRAIDQTASSEAGPRSAVELSRLFRELKAAWKWQTLDEIVRAANSTPDFAALFPAVLSAAEAGDPLAKSVLTQAGRELAQLAGIVVQRLFVDGGATVFLAMIGGVFRHSPALRHVFFGETLKLDPRVVVNPQIIEPVAGALQMARTGGTTEQK